MKEILKKYSGHIAIVTSIVFAATLLFYNYGQLSNPDQTVIIVGLIVVNIDAWVLFCLSSDGRRSNKDKKRSKK